jgi:hypothetical protein
MNGFRVRWNRRGKLLVAGLVASLIAVVAREYWSNFSAQHMSPTEARAYLKNHYGIELTGSVRLNDIRNVVAFAVNCRPRETKGLTFEFMSSRSTAVDKLGKWFKQGKAQIFSERMDTVFHEGTHHVLEFERNQRTRNIGKLVFRMAKELGGGKPDNSCVTRPYALFGVAQDDDGEFNAELFTGIAGLERGIKLETTVGNKDFNPPERIRKMVRGAWVALEERPNIIVDSALQLP